MTLVACSSTRPLRPLIHSSRSERSLTIVGSELLAGVGDMRFALFAGLRIGVARYSGVDLAFHHLSAYCRHVTSHQPKTDPVAALFVASVTDITGYSDIRFPVHHLSACRTSHLARL